MSPPAKISLDQDRPLISLSFIKRSDPFLCEERAHVRGDAHHLP
jgi:hypothetical protein